ncbi:MAG: hypothetical protein ABSC77_05265 [Terracidiphilus sp.]|jgi:hypothetical protein
MELTLNIAWVVLAALMFWLWVRHAMCESTRQTQFEAANPELRANALGVEEMKAAEITAFLRPNPQAGLSGDGLQIGPHTVAYLGTLAATDRRPACPQHQLPA